LLFFLAAAASYFDSSLLSSHESNQSQRFGAHFLIRVIVSFVPHITAILVGLETSTLFTNHDDIFRVRISREALFFDFMCFSCLSILVFISAHKGRFEMVMGVGLYFAIMCFINTTSSFMMGLMYLSAASIILISVVVRLFSIPRKEINRDQQLLGGSFVVFIIAHFATYCIQMGKIFPSEVASICFVLIGGCVRYCVTVVSLRGSESLENPLPGDNFAVQEFTLLGKEGKSGIEDEEVDESERHDECTKSNFFAQPQNQPQDDDRFFKLDKQDSSESIGIARRCSSTETLDNRSTSRRQLLRYVFHEMRAPLNVISMAVDLLTNQYKLGTTPKSRKIDLETLQMIEEATLTLERTLKDSMTLQKIEEGLLVPQLKIFSVLNMCDDVQDALSQVLRSSSVEFKYEVAKDVPDQIVGDHFRIRHVIAHVVSNAIKYSKPESKVNMEVSVLKGKDIDTVSVGLRRSGVDQLGKENEEGEEEEEEFTGTPRTPRSDDSHHSDNEDDSGGCVGRKRLASDFEAVEEGEYIVFRITDVGIGMSHELQQSDIFKPFATLKTEEVHSFRGSGLGLAICKKIMTFLKGAITYSSVSKKGTTFVVVYPFARLDRESMDEYDSDLSEHDQATTTILPMQSLSLDMITTLRNSDNAAIGSPGTIKRKLLVSKAKSFRGQKLFSLIQTQSSVFDCPTPQSSGTSLNKSYESLSYDLSEHFGSGSASGGVVPDALSTAWLDSIDEAEFEHTPRIDQSDDPQVGEVGEKRQGDRKDNVGKVEEDDKSELQPSSRFELGNLGAAPSRHLVTPPLDPTTVKRISLSRSHSRSPQRMRKLRGLSINTASESSNAGGESGYNSEASESHRSDTAGGDRSSLQWTSRGSFNNIHSSSNNSINEPPERILKYKNEEYMAITEKNVNLHILRTSSSSSLRVLPFPSPMRHSPSKRPLSEILKESRLLVVDDAASNRKLLQMLLTRAGFGHIDHAEDGQAAVDYCHARSEAEQPDIIFMDNTMPNLTGIEASQIIRSRGFKHLIIGVTGNSLDDELDAFVHAGADLVIVKPLRSHSLEMLLQFIREYGFESAHGYRIELVGSEYSWVPRGSFSKS